MFIIIIIIIIIYIHTYTHMIIYIEVSLRIDSSPEREPAAAWPGGDGSEGTKGEGRTGWGSDGNVYNVLRGLRDFWKPSGA